MDFSYFRIFGFLVLTGKLESEAEGNAEQSANGGA
jgi:hypothetical protein